MKIEIGESLGYSFLRHVKGCWLVQTNWKPSDQWIPERTQAELDEMFQDIKRGFDPNGSVFKGTKTVSQLLKQAEIDVLGVDLRGDVHALEVAFHEGGLNYGGGVDNRLSKKLLRAFMVLHKYHPRRTKFHIYFASPKVNPSVQSELERTFNSLSKEYPHVKWTLATNETFAAKILRPTVDRAGNVSDATELFMRSHRLMQMAGSPGPKPSSPAIAGGKAAKYQEPLTQRKSDLDIKQVQPVVRSLMTTLLEGWPDLLDDADKHNMTDPTFCEVQLGLKLAGFALLRDAINGPRINGRGRYYTRSYGGRFLVCSQWWKQNHLANARSLLRFVEELISRKPDHPGRTSLESHQRALEKYIGQAEVT